MTTAVLAGGCFWCLDAVFRRIRGVQASVCGYAGGAASEARYDIVSTGTTGHAEAVRVTFDDRVIPVDTVLAIFFLIHNPTTKDRQGADVGPQYRSALFYESNQQRVKFEQALARAQKDWNDPVITELAPLEVFYEAEPEHQDYFTNNPTSGYCSAVIEPKIIAARQLYAQWLL